MRQIFHGKKNHAGTPFFPICGDLFVVELEVFSVSL